MKKLTLLLISSFLIAQESLNEIITFESANPFSFEEIITDLNNQEKQTVFRALTFPENFDSDIKYPLIIGVAGHLLQLKHLPLW